MRACLLVMLCLRCEREKRGERKGECGSEGAREGGGRAGHACLLCYACDVYEREDEREIERGREIEGAKQRASERAVITNSIAHCGLAGADAGNITFYSTPAR